MTETVDQYLANHYVPPPLPTDTTLYGLAYHGLVYLSNVQLGDWIVSSIATTTANEAKIVISKLGEVPPVRTYYTTYNLLINNIPHTHTKRVDGAKVSKNLVSRVLGVIH